MPLIYDLILVSLVMTVVVSVVTKKYGTFILVSFVFGFIGALAFSFLTFGDAPFLMKYNFINTYSVSTLGAAIFVFLLILFYNKFSHDLSRIITTKSIVIFWVITLLLVIISPLFFRSIKVDNSCLPDNCPNNYSETENIDSSIVVDSFATCLEAGFAVMESYPRRCSSGDQTFTEEIGNVLEKMDLIRLETPLPNQKISSPLKISGEARGYWFFEASFPVVLTNWDGLIIAEGFLTAQDEWMTEDFVPFEGELTFTTPDLYNRGSLILMKDNPSGLPEHDDALEIPIKFDFDN